MNGYVKPKVVLLPNAVGLDLQIQTVQQILADGLPWLQTAFGRAFLQQEKRLSKKDVTLIDALAGDETVIYPECRGINQEPVNVMPNDNLKSYCFFVVRDPTDFVNFATLDTQTIVSTPLSLIFWVNLQKVNATKNYRFAEELKIDVLNILRGIPDVVLTQIYEQMDRVFEQFTITETYLQYTKPTFAAMRFDFNLQYPIFPENC